MLFSIIVPVYNVQEYLTTCVDSILNQTYTDFEAIFVNDGSTDDSLKILKLIKDPRVKIVDKANGGLVSARRAGLAVAQGEYVVCVDSDDWISENYLEIFALAIQKTKAQIVCCGHVKTDGVTKTNLPLNVGLGYYDKQRIEKEIYPILLENERGKYFSPMLWSKAIQRQLITPFLVGLDERIVIGEDGAVTKPCVYNVESLYVCSECGYYYRTNPKSLTKNKKAFDWDGPELRGRLLESQIDMSSFDFQAQLYRSVTHSLFNVITTQYYRKEKASVIKKDILKHLDNPYYKNAVKHCKFKGFNKATFAQFALKHKLLFLVKLYSKIK